MSIRLIDLGKASVRTRGLLPSSVPLDSYKIVENGLKYRAKLNGPAEPKIRDNA